MESLINYQMFELDPKGRSYNITNIYFLEYGMVAITYQIGNTVRTIELSVKSLEEMEVFNFKNLLPYIDEQ